MGPVPLSLYVFFSLAMALWGGYISEWEDLIEDAMTVIAKACDTVSLTQLARTSKANRARFAWRFNFRSASFAERRHFVAHAPVEILENLMKFWEEGARYTDEDPEDPEGEDEVEDPYAHDSEDDDPDVITDDAPLAMVESLFAHDTWHQEMRLAHLLDLHSDGPFAPGRFLSAPPVPEVATLEAAQEHMRQFWAPLGMNLVEIAYSTLNARFLEHFGARADRWFPSLDARTRAAVNRSHRPADPNDRHLLDEYFPDDWAAIFNRIVRFIAYDPGSLASHPTIWRLVRAAPAVYVTVFLEHPLVKTHFAAVARQDRPVLDFIPVGFARNDALMPLFRPLVSDAFMLALFGGPSGNIYHSHDLVYILAGVTACVTTPADFVVGAPNRGHRSHLMAAVIRTAFDENPIRFRWVDFLVDDRIVRDALCTYSIPSPDGGPGGFGNLAHVVMGVWMALLPEPTDTPDAFFAALDASDEKTRRLFYGPLAALLMSFFRVNLIQRGQATGVDPTAEIERIRLHFQTQRDVYFPRPL